MAALAAITLAVKAAIAAATNKRTWKALGVIIAAILTPFILECKQSSKMHKYSPQSAQFLSDGLVVF